MSGTSEISETAFLTCIRCNTFLTDTFSNLQALHLCPKCDGQWLVYEISTQKGLTADVDLIPQNRISKQEPSCYNHENNVGLAECSGCGRFLCSLCSIHKGQSVFCPSCWDAGKVVGRELSESDYFRNDAAAIVSSIVALTSHILCIPAAMLWLIFVWRHFTGTRSIYGIKTVGIIIATAVMIPAIFNQVYILYFFKKP